MRLGDGLQILFFDSSAKLVRQNGFDHILANGVCEPRPHQRLRHLSGAEAWNACHLLIALDDLLIAAGHLVRGQVDLDLAGAFRIQRRAVRVFMRMIVAFVIMSFVVMNFWGE